MSLLLDALKKAAEQKAEKDKTEGQETAPSDETVLDTAQEDISDLQPGDDSNLQIRRRENEDETEIDHTDPDTRLERTRTQRDPADETGLEVREETETQAEALSEQMQTGEDETIIFADEDVSEFMGEPEYVNRDPAEETDLSRLADETDADQTLMRPEAPAGEDTELSHVVYRDESDDSRVQFIPQADETDLSEVDDTDDTELSRDKIAGYADETDLSEVDDTDDTELSRVKVPGVSEETDLSGAEVDPVVTAGDDMSLLLRDQTGTTTSATDPQADQASILSSDAEENLGLVDVTQPPDPRIDETSTVSSTATTGVALDGLTTEGTATRADSTSTRTYAPDNYDRTLMKLPGEDASRLFAGMKSDADVVMTPDYAKKVFQSKSSVQRMQHYKVYAGIAVVIMLSIGVYGLFALQEEAFNIETSLRPLKRDPMPGLIKPAGEENASLFGETGVGEKALELVQSVENEGTVAEEVMEDTAEPEAETAVGTAETTEVARLEPESAIDQLVGEQGVNVSGTIVDENTSRAQASQSASTVAAGIDSTRADTPSVAGSDTAADSDTASLQISSSSRVEEKHALLREAYTAYQAGDDEAALVKYNQVLEIDPGNRNALLARAAINVQNNNVSDAIGDYRRLLLANPKDSLAMTSLITVANVSPDDAVSRLKLMIRNEPDSPYLNFALANAYGAQDRWLEAQGHYFTALENNPGDPNYAYNLAVSLEHIAKPRVALSYYQRALDNFDNGLAMFSRDVVDQRLETLGKL